MKALKESGAFTIAQDKDTSVVFGMPKSAISLGAASEVLPLGQIAPALSDFADRSIGRRLTSIPAGPATQVALQFENRKIP